MAAAPGPMAEDEVAKVFTRFDSNGDGRISAAELRGVVRSLGSEATPEEVQKMMDEMDIDRDGFVDLKEFAAFFSREKEGDGAGSGAGGDGDGQLMDAFRMYDLDGNGRISARELHLVMKRIGEKCSLGDCTKMIKSVDADGDGCVNFQEFKRMMTNGAGARAAEKKNKKKNKH